MSKEGFSDPMALRAHHQPIFDQDYLIPQPDKLCAPNDQPMRTQQNYPSNRNAPSRENDYLMSIDSAAHNANTSFTKNSVSKTVPTENFDEARNILHQKNIYLHNANFQQLQPAKQTAQQPANSKHTTINLDMNE